MSEPAGRGRRGERRDPPRGGRPGEPRRGASRPRPQRSRVIVFHKPYGVVTQFKPRAGHPTLAAFDLPPGVYAAGRLDRDSEGLLVLTDDGDLQHRLTDPRFRHEKAYLVEVEGAPSAEALAALAAGPTLRDGPTRPCTVRALATPPPLPPREPPVRFRKSIPTAWLEVVLTEGRNRQVRRMTAAVGLPTLRLVRVRIAGVELGDLARGAWRELAAAEVEALARRLGEREAGGSGPQGGRGGRRNARGAQGDGDAPDAPYARTRRGGRRRRPPR